MASCLPVRPAYTRCVSDRERRQKPYANYYSHRGLLSRAAPPRLRPEHRPRQGRDAPGAASPGGSDHRRRPPHGGRTSGDRRVAADHPLSGEVPANPSRTAGGRRPRYARGAVMRATASDVSIRQLPAEPTRVRPCRRSRRVRARGQAGTHRRKPARHDARGKPPIQLGMRPRRGLPAPECSAPGSSCGYRTRWQSDEYSEPEPDIAVVTGTDAGATGTPIRRPRC